MPGPRFEDTPEGPVYALLAGLTVPLAESLAALGMSASDAAVMAYRLVRGVVEAVADLPEDVSLDGLAAWGDCTDCGGC